jgi:predicted TIM-barrel fold metal-dependent hydrolase
MDMTEALALLRDNPVVNWHEHVWENEEGRLDEGRLTELVTMARALGMDTVVCSNPVLAAHSPPELFRRRNNQVREAMDRYPGLIRGLCFVNPGYMAEALAEVDRCVGQLGFIGVKLYHHYLISDPAVGPLLEHCGQMDLPVLVHACKLNFYGQYQPFASNGVHFAKAAERFPRVTLIHGHIGGGGDWQWSLKAMAPYGNVLTDLSGSVCDEGLVEQTVAYLGAERVLFGTDMSYCAGAGKIIAARLTLAEKRTILNNPRMAKYLQGKKAAPHV